MGMMYGAGYSDEGNSLLRRRRPAIFNLEIGPSFSGGLLPPMPGGLKQKTPYNEECSGAASAAAFTHKHARKHRSCWCSPSTGSTSSSLKLLICLALHFSPEKNLFTKKSGWFGAFRCTTVLFWTSCNHLEPIKADKSFWRVLKFWSNVQHRCWGDTCWRVKGQIYFLHRAIAPFSGSQVEISHLS